MSEKLSVIGEIHSEEVFMVLLEYEVARAKRYPTPIALLCIEITPDSSDPGTLQAASNLFASALSKNIRSADIPCVNGKEFKILLPATGITGLSATCERMLGIFNKSFETEDGSSISFALNIGGTLHEGGETVTRAGLLKNGQAALSQSKQKGINTYVILN